MLYFYYLIWLKDILYLAILQSQIQNNIEIGYNLYLFSKHIIKYLAYKDSHTKILD